MSKIPYNPAIDGTRAEWRAAMAAKQQGNKPKPANGHASTNGHAAVDGVEIPIAPELDHLAVRSHVEMLHKLAGDAGVDGILTFTRFDDKGNPGTERFAIGDVDLMADAINGWSRNRGVNVYLPWVVWRKSLEHGKKGGEADIRAVLAFVGDLDADKGKTAVKLDALPLPAPYVVETSKGNYHATFPLKRALTVVEAKPIAEALSDAIGGDSGTKDTSHIWRIPGTLNWPDKTKLERGRPRDPQKVKVKTPWNGEKIEPETISEAVKGFKKPADDPKPDGDKGKAWTFESLPHPLQKQIAAPPYAGEDRSATAMSVFAQLWRLGWSQDAVQAVVEAYPQGFCTHYGKPKYLAKDIARCFEKFGAEDDRDANEASPADDLPIIKVKAGRLSLLATKAEQMLIDAKVPLYQRSGALVRPIIETADASRGRKTKVATLKSLDSIYLRDLLGRHASWVKASKDKDPISGRKKSVPVDPPKEVALTILARDGEWMLPAIAGVITTPTMRPDGSLLTEQGYDEATRLLLVEPPPMPPIPDHPTKQDAESALKLFEDLLVGFPFVDDVARAVALSGIITPVVRGAFPVSPLHASRAPTASSGKSFIWDIVASIAIGQLMPVMSTGASTEEMEKRLGSALMKCQPLISIDNISGELGGDALCQAIERPVVDIRILGRSENVRVEAKGTTLFATGNNFVIVGDVCRRVIITNLDPQMEQPELRQFEFDPVLTVLKDRGKYIAAALTICRAYFVAGSPDKAARLASFEGWSDTVRSALIWLGKEDPVKSMEASRAEDPERLELMNMMEAWNNTLGIGCGSRLKLAAVLLKGAATARESDGAKLEPEFPELHTALEEICFRGTGRRNQPDARMLGNWLNRYKGRIINGKRFSYLPNPKGGSEWWLELVP